MKAARFHAVGALKLEDIEIPTIGRNDVLIEVAYCGICGTDTHIVEGHEGSTPVKPPRTLGHEFSGIIAAVGSEVTHVGAGDRVCADVNYSCGHCASCTRGRPHLCRRMQGIGTAREGALAEYIAVPAQAVFQIPDEVSLRAAAMVEPLSCCLHGIDRLPITLGDTVMIVGAGMIGLLMQQLTAHAGAATVIVVDPQSEQRKLASALGADLVIDPHSKDCREALRRHQLPDPNIVIDCAGTTKSAEMAIDIAGYGATVMLFGLTAPQAEISVRPFEVFQKELTITASFVNPWAYSRALTLIARNVVKVEPLISRVLPFDRINTVFSESLGSGKTLIEISGGQ